MATPDPTQFGVRLGSRLRPSWYTLAELEPSQKRPDDYLGKTPKYELQRDAKESSDGDKWKARVNRYWWDHPYRCQTCGQDGGQRPEKPWRGSVLCWRLDPFEGRRAPGDEKDDTLAALCKPCHQEFRYISNNTGEPMTEVVERFAIRHQAAESRRRHTITQQRREREHKRAREQEWRDEMAQRLEAGLPLGDPEYRAKYADVHRY